MLLSTTWKHPSAVTSTARPQKHCILFFCFVTTEWVSSLKGCELTGPNWLKGTSQNLEDHQNGSLDFLRTALFKGFAVNNPAWTIVPVLCRHNTLPKSLSVAEHRFKFHIICAQPPYSFLCIFAQIPYWLPGANFSSVKWTWSLSKRLYAGPLFSDRPDLKPQTFLLAVQLQTKNLASPKYPL